MSNPRRCYRQLSRCWYGPEKLKGLEYHEEIMVWTENEHGHQLGEFAIRWYLVDDTPKPKFESWDCAWVLFQSCRDLGDELAERSFSNPSPAVVRAILERLGFEDHTPLVPRP